MVGHDTCQGQDGSDDVVVGEEAGGDGGGAGQEQGADEDGLPAPVVHDQRAEDVRGDLDQGRQDEGHEDVRPELGRAHADPVVAEGDHDPVDEHDQGDLPGERVLEEVGRAQLDDLGLLLGFYLLILSRGSGYLEQMR